MANNLNSVALSGNLTRDPELRTTSTGKSVVGFRVANSRYGQSSFFDVTAWEKTAELIADIYGKGDMIVFTGEIKSREYEKDGQKRTAIDLIARDVQLPRKSESSTPAVVVQDEIEF